MIKSSVARRYAKALFDLLDPAGVEAARRGLIGLSEAVSLSPPLRHVLASPAFGADEKHAVLATLAHTLNSPPVMDQFLAQLVKKNRARLLPEIAQAFVELADKAKGTARISVGSATALSDAEQAALRKRLRELLKQEVDVEFHAEPDLLAGLQIRIGSMVYDSTVRNRLAAMQTVLNKE
ncbi:MAG TPA: ATP synthase F1 subunit delta [Nitrospiraceae bacterium]|jgi:F-type H+-transporting ATPase subunit delta|nr:ATP synthase F1 subunit delta [Nitrospiraceae bacterium]